jgi:hypothetical protein
LLIGATVAVGASILAAGVAIGGQEQNGGTSTAQYAPPTGSNSKTTPVVGHLGADSPTEDVIPVVTEHIFRLGGGRGFVGQRTDYDRRAVSVRWKGTPPAEVLEYIATRPYGVDITLNAEARYSREELEAARTRLLNSPRGASIVWTQLNNDGSGLRIGVTQTEPPTAADMAEIHSIAGLENVEVKTGAEPARTWIG